MSPAPAGPRRRGGYSLVELMVTLTIAGILAAASAPSLGLALERARADRAAANLQALWAAQRVHRLAHGTYAADAAALLADGLLDAALLADPHYEYRILPGADPGGFAARADRRGGPAWGGGFTIDEGGLLGGCVTRHGAAAIRPSSLFIPVGDGG